MPISFAGFSRLSVNPVTIKGKKGEDRLPAVQKREFQTRLFSEAISSFEFHSDDFGLFPAQSKRILDCHSKGVLNGVSIMQTAQALRERILDIAHQQTRMPVSNLDLVDGQIVRKSDGRVLKSLGDLATESLYSLEHSQHITAETTAQIKSKSSDFNGDFSPP